LIGIHLQPDLEATPATLTGSSARIVPQKESNRFSPFAFWLTPIAVCLALYFVGLRVWFMQDDFYWLSLHNYVKDAHSLAFALFAPMAQGTIRPLGERGFFLLFSHLFGVNALPYRIFVFLNQFVNVALIAAIAQKLTRSAVAGMLAPILWLFNIALIAPMSWNSAYNEIQCATFLLASFFFFLKYVETDRRSFYRWQWLTFVLGFGALELNVVYPFVAALYAVLFARKYLQSTAPLFAGSALYLTIHLCVPAPEVTSYYRMDFHPASLASTFLSYWKTLFGFAAFARLQQLPNYWPDIAVAVFTAVVVYFSVRQRREERKLSIFFFGWFVIFLALLLPFAAHITEYYLTIPSIGMAMLGAYSVLLAWRSGATSKAMAMLLVSAYVLPSAVFIYEGTRVYRDRSERVHSVVRGVTVAKELLNQKTIILEDVDDELFWTGLYFHPFSLFGWKDVYVGPESERRVQQDPHLPPIDDYFLSPAETLRLLRSGRAAVLSINGRTLKDITRPYSLLNLPDPTSRSSVE